MAMSLSEKFFTAGEELVETGQRYIDNIGVTITHPSYEDSTIFLRLIDNSSLFIERTRIKFGRTAIALGQTLKKLNY